MVQYNNGFLPGEAEWRKLANRLVCTSDKVYRCDCGNSCSGCKFLVADRRSSPVDSFSRSRLDRRIASNWLPNYAIAGLGTTAAGAEGPLAEMTTWLPLLLATLLVTFNLMDSLFTARALSMGYAEANPMLAGIFNLSVPVGILLKTVVVGLGAFALWKLRHLQLAMRGMTVATSCYGVLILYHLYFQIYA